MKRRVSELQELGCFSLFPSVRGSAAESLWLLTTALFFKLFETTVVLI